MRSTCVAPDGVLIDLGEDDTPDPAGPAAHAWIRAAASSLLFDSRAIVAAATSDPPYYDCPGLYFLIWQGHVCYVGQAGCVGTRLLQHYKEGRPIDRVAVILGLPRWALTEIEYAYATAWDLPWNSERTRCGWPALMREIAAEVAKLDRSAIMPRYVPRVTGSQAAWKTWRLQVIGRLQATAKPPASSPPRAAE